MKLLAALFLLALTLPSFADEQVRGYTRRDGTIVQPYMRTDPNQYRFDNYSSQGNTNPYNGQRGSQRNEFSDPPAYNKSFGNPNESPTRNPYGR